MKTIITIVLIVLGVTSSSAQKFVEISSGPELHKFPKLQYEDHPNIEEKVNSYLQLIFLKHLPGKFEEYPFEIIDDESKVTSRYMFQSWEQTFLNSNIIDIILNGTRNGKPFQYKEYFDSRTGDSFVPWDLLNDKGKKEVDTAIKQKIGDLVDEGKLPSLEQNVSLSYSILQDALVFIFLDADNEELVLPFSELESSLSEYGKNLLYSSDNVLRRPSISGKLLRGVGGYGDSKRVKCTIFIQNIKETGEARVFRWNTKLKNKQEYTEATIKDGVLQADDYYLDKFTDKKTHGMYSLHLEKQKDNSWIGELQLGSPSYPMVFKEY